MAGPEISYDFKNRHVGSFVIQYEQETKRINIDKTHIIIEEKK